MVAMNKKVQKLEAQSQANASMATSYVLLILWKEHPWDECPLQVEIVNYNDNFNKNQNNPYSNIYNRHSRNHPNFGWGGFGRQKLHSQLESQAQVQASP